jgi:hypothetical protein
VRAVDTAWLRTTGRSVWSRLGESNPGPTHYECVALAN